MKAKATVDFSDREAGIIRAEGETFECTKERLDVLVAAGYAVAVASPKKGTRKTVKR